MHLKLFNQKLLAFFLNTLIAYFKNAQVVNSSAAMLVALQSPNFQFWKSFTVSKSLVPNEFARFLVFYDFANKLTLFLLKCVYFWGIISLTRHVCILVFVSAIVYIYVYLLLSEEFLLGSWGRVSKCIRPHCLECQWGKWFLHINVNCIVMSFYYNGVMNSISSLWTTVFN